MDREMSKKADELLRAAGLDRNGQPLKSSSEQRSVRVVSTPMGGQPGWKRRR